MNLYASRAVSWAEGQPEIRAVILVGSQARIDHPADAWSDVDLQVFVTNAAPFLANSGWTAALGEVWVCIPYQPPGGEPERLVILEGGQKVDFHFFPVSELAEMVEGQFLRDVYHRGYEIILDKDGLAARLPACPYAPPPFERPSQDEYTRFVELFWFEALQHAKMLARGELWLAKLGEYRLIQRLGQVIEWYAHAASGGHCDAWHSGRFLLEWSDEATRAALPGLFSRFDAADGWRALAAITALFRRLAVETAQAWGYAYPEGLDQRVSEQIHLFRGAG